LEDSGYLARAVTLVDGPFSYIGLSGRSLFPFLSGFACAIPATLSARSISSKRERWITIFVLPFMTCSARLPVYALLLSFLFYGDSAWKPGLLMSILYFLSLLLGILAAGILNVCLKSDKKSSFFMELPLYRRPVLSNILSSSWSRTRHFIWKAGPVIFTFALIMWVATHFPRYSDVTPEEQIQKSYAGQFGQVIEPVFERMGGDWRVGVSLLSAFVAREVFVSVLAVTLKNTGSEAKNSFHSSMVETMRMTEKPDGSPLFSRAGILALLVFFIFSLQCLSTTGIVYKETGSWKFAAVQLISLNFLAYVGAVVTYHLLV
jgi:ferrous iron transport protein B